MVDRSGLLPPATIVENGPSRMRLGDPRIGAAEGGEASYPGSGATRSLQGAQNEAAAMTMQALRQPTRHLLSAHDFHRMGEAGILGADERIELIEGELIDMVPIGSLHAGTVMRLNQLLIRVLAGRAMLSPQNPIALAERSEPQPDITVLRNRADFYSTSHPVPQDVLLLIEVADSTLSYDRDVKIPLYARYGIPEVWLVDLNARRVEVCRRPAEAGYRERFRPENAESVALSLLPEVSIALADLWS